MILHAHYAAQSDRGLVIWSPDTDVLDFRSLDCRDFTGVKDQHSLIQGMTSSKFLTSLKMRNCFLGFHAITGCDSTSSLAGIGKKKARDGFYRSIHHQDSLSLFAEG